MYPDEVIDPAIIRYLRVRALNEIKLEKGCYSGPARSSYLTALYSAV